MKPDTLPIIEAFYSIQGEPYSIGRPAFFIRLPGCNLACKYCDTVYASRVPVNKGEIVNLLDLVKEIKDLPTNLVVITGGEPLLYRKDLKKFMDYFGGYEFEIETNGTLPPLKLTTIERLENTIRYNVSPKLASSGNNILDRRRLQSLSAMLAERSIFKFVVKTDEDWEEMEYLIEKVGIPTRRVYVMPCSVTQKQWQKGSLKFVEKIKDKGYNLAPRLQVALYGRKKGV